MTRDELIAAMQVTSAQTITSVTVKGWGIVHVRSLTVAEVDEQTEIDEKNADKKDKNRLARGAARMICDEAGNRIFDPNNDADVALLAKQPWTMLQKVLAAPDDKGKDAGN